VSAENTYIPGIDVSNWQGTIDWQKVKSAGVQFVFIKASQGTGFHDRFFPVNIKAARLSGIACGAYHFFEPMQPAQSQAENFLSMLGALEKGDLPPVLDVETPANWTPLSVADRVKAVTVWLGLVEKQLGTKPLLYMSSSFSGDVLGADSELKRYPLWLAHYTKAAQPWVPAPFQSWAFWQYSNTGKTDGITGDVDQDWFNGNVDDLQKLRYKSADGDSADAKIH
jgi:lysozyme